MLNPKLNILLILFLTLFFTGCGDGDYSDSSRDNPPQPENVETPESFRTRLNNTLLISGEKCRGGETTASNGQVITCNAGQYLVTVDNINTCDSSGICTQVVVVPIIGELETSTVGDPTFAFFNIIPISAASITQTGILNTVRVKVNLDGTNPQVVFK